MNDLKQKLEILARNLAEVDCERGDNGGIAVRDNHERDLIINALLFASTRGKQEGAFNLTYIKPLRTLVWIESAYAVEIRNLLNTHANDVAHDNSNSEVVNTLIDLLVKDEGDTVTFCSSNADFNNLPNEVITINASWTDWKDSYFYANTRIDCLRLAVAAMIQSKKEEK